MATQDEIRAKDVLPQLTDFRDDTDGFYGDGDQSSFFMKALDLVKSILGRIHLLPTAITSFRTGDVIAVDGPSGAAKMSKDTLKIDLDQIATTITMDGNGSTAVISKNFFCKPNSIYKVTVSDPTWSVETLSSLQTKLAIRGMSAGGTATDLLQRNKEIPVTPSLYINTGTYSVLSIFFRGDVGESVNFTFEPVADVNLGSSFENKVSLYGEGNTAVSYKFNCVAPSVLWVSIPNSWSITNVSVSYAFFIVRYYDSDNNIHDLIKYTKGDNQVLPSLLYVNVPAEARAVDLYVRGDSGVEMTFDVMVTPGYIKSKILGDNIKETLSFAGANTIDVVKKFGAVTGAKIIVVPSKTDWSVDNVAAATNKFILRYYDSNNVAHNLVAYPKESAVPNFVVSSVPTEATAMDIFFRGDIGESVDFDIFVTAPEVLSEDAPLGRYDHILKSVDGQNQNPVTNTFYVISPATIIVVPSKTDWSADNITSISNKFVLRYYDSNNQTHDIVNFQKGEEIPPVIKGYCPAGATKMDIFVRADVGESVNFDIYWSAPEEVKYVEGDVKCIAEASSVISINHRGYNSEAPENTLPAFRLSAKKGFVGVETDIRLTFDNKFVCIHDDTLDRTSNGTGPVNEKTLDQIKALDFGSWKSAEYAGVKCPTFEEFVACCKQLGLYMFIEIKDGVGHLSDAVDVVKKYAMEESTAWESFDGSALTEIKTLLPDAKLTLLSNGLTTSQVQFALGLKTSSNRVAIGIPIELVTDEVAETLRSNGLLLETWFVDSWDTTVHPYVSAVTSNDLVCAYVMWKQEMDKSVTT